MRRIRFHYSDAYLEALNKALIRLRQEENARLQDLWKKFSDMPLAKPPNAK